ncbi:MAG: response regulator [Treponema sp.]|nr:response regulator [Treponema sp.]
MKRKKTILVIDDVSETLRALKVILEDKYTVRLSKSGELADSILGSVCVDLILLDIEMPGISGLDYAKRLKQNPSTWHIPIVFISGHSAAEIVQYAGQLDIKGYIKKPASPEFIMEKVDAVLSIT